MLIVDTDIVSTTDNGTVIMITTDVSYYDHNCCRCSHDQYYHIDHQCILVSSIDIIFNNSNTNSIVIIILNYMINAIVRARTLLVVVGNSVSVSNLINIQ